MRIDIGLHYAGDDLTFPKAISVSPDGPWGCDVLLEFTIKSSDGRPLWRQLISGREAGQTPIPYGVAGEMSFKLLNLAAAEVNVSRMVEVP